MLRKYLKYDFKAVLPIWWIAAVVLGGLSVLAGVCARILAVKDWENFAGIPWEIFGIILFVMGIGAFSVITYVLVYLRYFNNFFGDEGYLTFTLPIPRRTLLFSKLINAALFQLMSLGTIIVSVSVVLWLTPTTDGGNALFGTINLLITLLRLIGEAVGYGWLSVYSFVFVIIAALGLAISVLVPCMCITVGSMVARRAKLLVGIGLIFGVTYALSTLVQISAYSFAIWAVAAGVSFPVSSLLEGKFVSLLIMFIPAIAMAAISIALYNVTIGCLERKLNLS